MNPATRVYQQRLAAIRTRTANAAVAAWDGLADYDRPSVTGFTSRAIPIVTAGQLLAGRATSAYVARRTRLPAVPISARLVTGPAARRGAVMADVYERPFRSVWADIGNGADLATATARGRAQLAMLAATDVWLATRAASAVIDRAQADIKGWVRVADGGACDICSAADGMPLAAAGDLAGHPNCGCTAEPLLEAPDMAAASDQIDTTVDDELGPLLVAA